MESLEHNYTLWSNLVFLLNEMRRNARRSFWLMWVGIPLKVLLPFIGILLPEIVVRAITEGGELKSLLSVIFFSAGYWCCLDLANSTFRESLRRRRRASR